MTKEKLKIAFEINIKINTFEDAIENLKNNTKHKITSVDSGSHTWDTVIPQEIVNFAIDWFTKEKEKLEKEFEEL